MTTVVVRGTHPDVSEFPQEKPWLKPRVMHRITGVSTNVKISSHNNTYNNLRRGIMERVFYVESNGTLEPPIQPSYKAFKQLSVLRKRFAGACGNHSPIGVDSVVAMYKGRKLRVYQQAAIELTYAAEDPRWARVKNFLKYEKLNTTKKKDPAARIISPRDPKYNLLLGRYLKKYEHHAYRALDKIWGGATVMKGYTVSEIAKHIKNAWDQFRAPVAIGFDMKRFDQHVSKNALQFEHSCYLACFQHSPELARLLSYQLVNKCKAYCKEGSIKYEVEGKRMSGDLNTALGNCLLACLITKHMVDKRSIKARLINNGDDCVLIVDKSNLQAVLGLDVWWEEFGFKCIMEDPVDTLERIEFCQMRPVFDGSSYVMVREPFVSTAKDVVCKVPLGSTKAAKKWAKAVGECGLSLTGAIPIVQEFYAMLIRNSGNVKAWSMKACNITNALYNSPDSDRGYQPITEEARYSFYLAFGIPPDVQIAVEELYRSTNLCWEWSRDSFEFGDLELSCLLKTRKS